MKRIFGATRNLRQDRLLSLLVVVLAILALDLTFSVRRPYVESDLSAYKMAQRFLRDGQDPYARDAIRAEWERLGHGHSADVAPKMVWNPPIFFVYPGVFFRFSENILFGIWPIVSTLAALALGAIGWRIATARPLAGYPVGGAVLLCLPWWLELNLSQLSSLVALPCMFGFLLFFQRRDFAAGLSLSLALVKPHLVFLPYVLLG